MNYYDILGVPSTATQDDIKKAYKTLAKQYHPDLHPDDPDIAEKFKEINEAYQILSDPEKRKNYDSPYENIGYSQKININEVFNIFGEILYGPINFAF